MLKTLPWRMMVFGCTLGVLAGLLAVAFELDFPGQICEYSQATKHEDCTTYSLFPFLLIKVGKTLNDYGIAITALATVAIGFFTLTLKWSTDRLWGAGEKQRVLYEDTAARQLRAYVFIESALIQNIADPFGPEIFITIRNAGQTPAYKVTHINRYEIFPYPLTGPLALPVAGPNDQPSRFDLGPNTTTKKYKRYKPINIPIGAALAHGKAVLYVYGEILYTDIFEKPHFTRYKMMIGGPIADRGPNALAAAPDGNESD